MNKSLLILAAAPIVYEVMLTYFPLADALIHYDSTRILSEIYATLSNPVIPHAFEQSLLQGWASAAASLALGYPVGLALGTLRFKGEKLYRALVFIPFMLPSVVAVVGFNQAYGFSAAFKPLSTGLSGIVAVNTFYNAPFVALLVATSIAGMNKDAVWAIKAINPRRTSLLRKVLIPTTLRSAATGAAVAFVYSYLGFLIPLAVGGPAYYTQEVEVYVLLKTLYRPAESVTLALAQSIIPILMASFLVARGSVAFNTGYGGDKEAPSLVSSRKTVAAAAALLAGFALYEVTPLAAVVYSSGLISYAQPGVRQLLEASALGRLQLGVDSVITNSVVYAVLASAITLALAVSAAHYSASQGKRRLVYQYGVFFPLAFSPVTLGVSLYLAYGGYPAFTQVWPMIVAAQSAVALPLASRFMIEGLSRVRREYVWAARTAGAGVGDTLFRVELPIAFSAVMSALMVSMDVALGEFAATTTIYTPRYTTIPIAIYTLFQLRLPHAAAALSVILLAVSATINYLVIRGGAMGGSKT